ncbi:MAG: PUR family DNA/RNA-binding protein [Bacteroidota bacterium]|nr:PUR family DNA/RNA-binding protein [Bacteroidota bacterium]
MAYENNDKKMESVYSQRIRAGKRRTYFFDVRETRGNDFYLTITESRKKFNEDGYDRHKIFLYKEDFNKFLKGMTEVIDFVKTDLMPDFDFDAFNHDNSENYEGNKNYEGSTAPVKNEDTTGTVSQEKTDEAPTGIAAAATPEIEPEPEPELKKDESPVPPVSHHDEEVDKW